MNLPKYFYFRVKVKNHGTAIEVEDASDADVVEVVRCIDCRWWSDKNGGFCDILGLNINDDEFFCAWGEKRREGNE